LLQQAAHLALQSGRSEIDTEHLLAALLQSEVVQEVLRQFKLKPEEIQADIELGLQK